MPGKEPVDRKESHEKIAPYQIPKRNPSAIYSHNYTFSRTDSDRLYFIPNNNYDENEEPALEDLDCVMPGEFNLKQGQTTLVIDATQIIHRIFYFPQIQTWKNLS